MMDQEQEEPLRVLMEHVRKAGLVDRIEKKGRTINISVGGEQFNLSPERAAEFLSTLLRIGRSQPLPPASGRSHSA